MDVRECSKCGKTKFLNDFYAKKRGKICTQCYKDKVRLWHAEHPENRSAINKRYKKSLEPIPERKLESRRYGREYYRRNKEKIRKVARSIRTRNLDFIESIRRQSKCSKCLNDDFRCLHFHHLGDKRFNISEAHTRMLSIENIEAEIKKCIILCANCHSIFHYEERQASKKRISFKARAGDVDYLTVVGSKSHPN